jgi:hypothetical protein
VFTQSTVLLAEAMPYKANCCKSCLELEELGACFALEAKAANKEWHQLVPSLFHDSATMTEIGETKIGYKGMNESRGTVVGRKARRAPQTCFELTH